ncbi:hypothetical protein JNB71_19720 [Rhizobium herbae]|uniref:Uncharacterized protein n=1 Tax=Rhizobium herbae TaxID=508661 RepID=A0ABS7HFS0_9HYPH|nr:hypothetical protein [Rhizobium herbae]MBW9065536.1 hypothetical protein [Rhizobium herbae]
MIIAADMPIESARNNCACQQHSDRIGFSLAGMALASMIIVSFTYHSVRPTRSAAAAVRNMCGS